jgi:hypothetical protein
MLIHLPFAEACDFNHISECGESRGRRSELGKNVLWVAVMQDARNLLETLKTELEFVEKGGYRNRPRFPWRPSFVFEDSPTCLNFEAKEERRPCAECLLMQFVPEDQKKLRFPCRHIPLTPEGDSVSRYYESGTEEELEIALKGWLTRKIAELEAQEKGKSQTA